MQNIIDLLEIIFIIDGVSAIGRVRASPKKEMKKWKLVSLDLEGWGVI